MGGGGAFCNNVGFCPAKKTCTYVAMECFQLVSSVATIHKYT